EDKDIVIGVIRLPKISNFTDIDPFESEEDVGIKMIDINDNITDIDALIIPGTRNSTEDAKALEESGISTQIKKLANKIPIIGICVGYQILGNHINDENKKESEFGSVRGLGLLDIESTFKRDEKVVRQSEATIMPCEIFKNIAGELVTGYELHEGTTKINENPLLKIEKGFGNDENRNFDGATHKTIFGTYLHGIFHNYNFRCEFLNYLREKKGLKAKSGEDPYKSQKDYSINRLAEIVEENIDMEFIDNLIFKK
ncbi:MAG: cobyric acid synthase CobQ, partial [Methanobrevibacter sp.]|nr:cobyric acid synthase CobQ [Methanobrevibacter sp.]